MAIFYGLTTFEGSFMAIRAVNSLSHYTDWTVGYVHAGALGWVAALIGFGALYSLTPALWGRERMHSAWAVEAHFWLALAGTLIYVFAMWNSGVIQGLMWRTYDTGGAVGGALFLADAAIGAWNVWMTIKGPSSASQPAGIDQPLSVLAGE